MITKMPSDKSEVSELRLLARFYDLLDQHQQEIRKRFNEFHQEEYHKKVLEVVESEHGIHLPNIFNFNQVYKFIQAEIDDMEESCIDLVTKVSQLCMTTVIYFIKVHFKRFDKVAEAIVDRCRQEFETIFA